MVIMKFHCVFCFYILIFLLSSVLYKAHWSTAVVFSCAIEL